MEGNSAEDLPGTSEDELALEDSSVTGVLSFIATPIFSRIRLISFICREISRGTFSVLLEDGELENNGRDSIF